MMSIEPVKHRELANRVALRRARGRRCPGSRQSVFYHLHSRNSLFTSLSAGLIVALLSGCHKTAPTQTTQNQQDQFQQVDRGEALLKVATSQLNDLPSAVDTELRPPVVILDSLKSADGQDVLATCTANPTAPEVFGVIRVPARNSRFRSLGVHAGDILKYYVKEDQTVDADSRNAGYSRQLAMEFHVAQVLDDSTLLLENGLNQQVDPPRKIEIWRYADDRLQELHEKLRVYEVYRRPPLGWEPAPDEPVLTQVMDWLNQWIRSSNPKTDWKREPLLDTLRADLRSDKQLAEYISPDALAAPGFQPADARLLQETVWLRDISRWAHGDKFDDLSRATALFDWTVRNIQLEADDNASPHRPWQALLYGRGTAEQRAWVFALLCRQQGLDVVILALSPAAHVEEKSGSTPATSAKFWLPALVAEGQLYLFDTRLGIPLPGPGAKGVATLEQVRKDDALLRQLDLEGAAYPVTADAIKSVEIDLVADPFSLTRRANQVEANLAGEDRLVLSARSSELAARLKTVPGIGAVRLWDYPFQTLLDQLSLGKSARHREALEFEPFAMRPALWKARTRHFQGRRLEVNAAGGNALADVVDDHQEAARLYMSKSVRPTEKEIAGLASENEQRVDSMAKLNAAYFIGLLSFDDGKYAVAANWLGRPELAAPGSPWVFGAALNLARALEAQANFDEAAAILQRDTSPQQQGNKLRAKALKARPKETKPGE